MDLSQTRQPAAPRVSTWIVFCISWVVLALFFYALYFLGLTVRADARPEVFLIAAGLKTAIAIGCALSWRSFR